LLLGGILESANIQPSFKILGEIRKNVVFLVVEKI